MAQDKNKQERPESYPKPTETDTQLNNQPEYTEPEAESRADKVDDSEALKQAQERLRNQEK